MTLILELLLHLLHHEDLLPHIHYLIVIVCIEVKFVGVEDVQDLQQTKHFLVKTETQIGDERVHLGLSK